MKKAIVASVAMLALVLGFGLFPAIPAVQAADVLLSIQSVPGSPDEYHIGDTINYVMRVDNPNSTMPMTVDIWDELPPHYDNPNPAAIVTLDHNATFAPLETRVYHYNYVIRLADLEQLQCGGSPCNVIINTLRVHGVQQCGLIDAEVTKASIIIQPNTVTTILPRESAVFVGQPANLTITEKNTGDVSLTGAYVELFDDGTMTHNLTYSLAALSGGNGDSVLDPGETGTWTVTTSPVNSNTTFVAIGHGTDPLGLDVTYPKFPNERDEVTVQAVLPVPNSLLTITSSAYKVHTGDEVALTIKEKNTGNVPLTSVYVELLADGAMTDNLTRISATPSDGNYDSVLDPGETWTWTVTSSPINDSTTFVAIGHGLDPAKLDITPENGFQKERGEITVTVDHPDTRVNITCNDDKVLLTITETNTGDIALTNVYVELFANDISVGMYYAPSAAFSGGNGDQVLDPGETWTWTVTRCISATTTFVAIGHGLDPAGLDITYWNGFLGERDQVTLRIICLRPDTQVTITSNKDQVEARDPFTLTISEKNTGCVSLTGAYVEVFADGVMTGNLTHSSAEFGGGNSDAILDPGETWTWTVTQSIGATTTFVAIGHGRDSGGSDITYQNGFLDERDEVTVEVSSVAPPPPSPDSTVTMTADYYVICAAQQVELTISEENTGKVPLTDVYVELFADGVMTGNLTHSSAEFGGGNSDAILDPGETWTWTVARTITKTTTFVAVGHGLDPTELDITPENGFQQESAEITVVFLIPGTEVSITSNKSDVYQDESFTLTVTERNTGDVPLSGVHIDLSCGGSAIATLDYLFCVSRDGNGNVLDPGETWTWKFTRKVTETTTFVAIGHGKDPGGLDVTYPKFPDERDEITVTVMSPGTEVTVNTDHSEVCDSQSFTLTISEANTGAVALKDAYVELFACGISLSKLDTYSDTFSGGNSDDILDPGETWTWKFTRKVTETTTFVAIGHGKDPGGLDVTYPKFPDERDEITVQVKTSGEATRTIGFWKTHYDYTSHVFTYHLGASIDLGWVQLNSVDDIEGMLWADVAKDSTGAKRDELCQARVIASKQAVAAILNSSLENGAPMPVSLSEIASTLGGTDIAAIQALGEKLDQYNNSGDGVEIAESDGAAYMSATPQVGKSVDVSIADYAPVSSKTKGSSPAYYGFAGAAVALAILLPVGILRARKHGNK